MGVDCSMVCVTTIKDHEPILTKIEQCIKELCFSFNQSFEDCNYTIDFVPEINCFNVFFTINNEERRLFVSLGSDSDYEELSGQKIIMSLGQWGSANKIISFLALEFSSTGTSYMRATDDAKWTTPSDKNISDYRKNKLRIKLKDL